MAQRLVQLTPRDEYNQQLEANVHPPEWPNPASPRRPYHLVVIGAGTAGLVTAAGAARLGARVALIERELMGGDCLNVGCVPSKALLHAARVAATVRDAASSGVHAADPRIDFAAVMQRMRRLRAQISPADSAQRFQDLGADVYFGQGAFIDDSTIAVTREDGSLSELKYKKAVIATGARASAPRIPGLDTVRALTNENLFSLTELPERLGIVGSGPIGCEMAQAFARFGSEVFLFEKGDRILSREDPDAAAVVQQAFEKEGIRLKLKCHDMSVSASENQIQLRVNQDGEHNTTNVDELLIAAGRAPNVEGLNLDAVQVQHDSHGITVNDYLQSSNPSIYAAGDVCSKYQFTHAADFMARIVLQNALFALGPLGRKKVSRLLIPWATYTSPEVAHVGIYENDVAASGMELDTYVQELSHVDRAILDSQTQGFVKIHTKKGTDKILGATIVAENAGDLISEITLAMQHNIGLGKIAATIHPYPTQAESIRKLGDQFSGTRLTPLSRRLLNFLRNINVGR